MSIVNILLAVLAVLGIILLAVIVSLCVLSLFKFKVYIGYTDVFRLYLRLGLIKVTLVPSKPKKEKPKKPKKEKPKKEKEENGKPKKQGKFSKSLSGLDVFDYIELVRIVTDKFVKKIFFEKINVEIKVAGDDASKTAVNYGRLNAAIFPIAGLISNEGHIENLHVNITPDFTSEKSDYKAEAVLYIRLFRAIFAAISVLKYIIR